MEMEGEVGKRALECILMPAMSAARNVRAQRDRLLQLRRRLQKQQRSSSGSGPGSVQEVAADLFKVYSTGLRAGGGYLSNCLHLAYENDADLSFSNPEFAFIPDEQLYHTLFDFARRLPRSRSTGFQTEAFARIELAFFAVKLPSRHHLPRCIEFLVGERPPSDAGKPDDCVVGYADDTLAAATDYIFKTRLSDMVPPDDADADATERSPRTRPRRPNRARDPAAATERSPRTRPRRPNRARDPAAATERIPRTRPLLFDPAPETARARPVPAWEPPQVASSTDPDQALSYLHRACSLASLAVKHIDLAVAVISSFLDPKEVAEIAEMAEECAYISEEGPYPSDD